MQSVYRLCGTYLLGGPADALLEPLGGEPHLDLLLGVLGGGREPGQLRLRGVRELVERRHERQVPVQRGVVLGGVEGHRDLRHLRRHTERSRVASVCCFIIIVIRSPGLKLCSSCDVFRVQVMDNISCRYCK